MEDNDSSIAYYDNKMFIEKLYKNVTISTYLMHVQAC